MSSQRRVPRSIRALNIAALLLLLVGGGLYVRAWIGMRWIRDEYVAPPDAPLGDAMVIFNRYWNMSRIGASLVLGAVALAVIAAAILAFAQRRAKDRTTGADTPDTSGPR